MTKRSQNQIQTIFTAAIFLLGALAFADSQRDVNSKAITKAQEQNMIQHNLRIKREQILKQLSTKRDFLSPLAASKIARPFSDHEQVSYVFFSAENYYDSAEVKKAILKNLPAGVIAVVFVDTENQTVVESYQEQYAQYVQNPDQLMVIAAPNLVSGGSNLWARDNVPIPVFSMDNHVMSVDAKYYRFYEADQSVADFLGTKLISHDYYYEGGNFQADDDGTCIMVNNSRHKEIPDNVFAEMYGCKRLKRLAHLSGIGHADERLKILKNKVVLTDTPEYRSELEGLGYHVVMLPKPLQAFETYANALVLNETVFLPVFKETHDAEAISIYEKQGFKVIPVYVNALPNQGRGSIHCITMTYPSIH